MKEMKAIMGHSQTAVLMMDLNLSLFDEIEVGESDGEAVGGSAYTHLHSMRVFMERKYENLHIYHHKIDAAPVLKSYIDSMA